MTASASPSLSTVEEPGSSCPDSFKGLSKGTFSVLLFMVVLLPAIFLQLDTTGPLVAVTWIASLGIVAFSVWSLFDLAERNLSPDGRIKVSQWLQRADPTNLTVGWPYIFSHMFDRIFGDRHISFRCIFGSSVASYVSVIVVLLLWFAIRPFQSISGSHLSASEQVARIGATLATAFIVNLLPDYLSLLETRIVIRMMKDGRNVVRTTALLVLDFVLTTVVATVAAIGIQLYKWMGIGSSPLGDSIEVALRIFIEDVLPLQASTVPEFPALYESWQPMSVRGIPFGVFFYSTFFTSIWAWLFAGAGVAVRFTDWLHRWFGFLKNVLDVEKYPLRIMGLMATLLSIVAYVISTLILLFFFF